MAWKTADEAESTEGLKEIRGGVPFWTPPTADPPKWKTSRVRFLPPRADHPTNRWYEWVSTHGNLPGANRPVLCPHRMYDEPCPACKMAQDLQNAGLKEDARDLWPSWRGLVNIVELTMEGQPLEDDPTIKIWGMPHSLVEVLNAKLEEMPKGSRNFTHPLTGRDVFVRRQGKQMKSKYEIALAPETSPVADIIMALLESDEERLHFLPGIYERTTSESIRVLLAAPSEKPLRDPFDVGSVVDGSVRELPAPAVWPEPPEPLEPVLLDLPWNDDEEEAVEEEEEVKPPKTSAEATNAARKRLQDKLAGAV